jgi:uncharacterized membrane protein
MFVWHLKVFHFSVVGVLRTFINNGSSSYSISFSVWTSFCVHVDGLMFLELEDMKKGAAMGHFFLVELFGLFFFFFFLIYSKL